MGRDYLASWQTRSLFTYPICYLIVIFFAITTYLEMSSDNCFCLKWGISWSISRQLIYKLITYGSSQCCKFYLPNVIDRVGKCQIVLANFYGTIELDCTYRYHINKLYFIQEAINTHGYFLMVLELCIGGTNMAEIFTNFLALKKQNWSKFNKSKQW